MYCFLRVKQSAIVAITTNHCKIRITFSGKDKILLAPFSAKHYTEPVGSYFSLGTIIKSSFGVGKSIHLKKLSNI